uniref:Uncharacterized protein n=1 Tax=Sexangularia sp. CB-2014 TaxID=1486929 RepID=A0A7S1YA76_9EUKA|mmetsp:Transcript_12786/g.40394  ORF Transcript_12786/g.40394 Transcript_12786/m.40394 type:complete len:290 (+) Transcript_12786:68-937(+)
MSDRLSRRNSLRLSALSLEEPPAPLDVQDTTGEEETGLVITLTILSATEVERNDETSRRLQLTVSLEPSVVRSTPVVLGLSDFETQQLVFHTNDVGGKNVIFRLREKEGYGGRVCEGEVQLDGVSNGQCVETGRHQHTVTVNLFRRTARTTTATSSPGTTTPLASVAPPSPPGAADTPPAVVATLRVRVDYDNRDRQTLLSLPLPPAGAPLYFVKTIQDADLFAVQRRITDWLHGMGALVRLVNVDSVVGGGGEVVGQVWVQVMRDAEAEAAEGGRRKGKKGSKKRQNK